MLGSHLYIFLNQIANADALASEHKYPLEKAPGMVSTVSQDFLHTVFQKILTDKKIYEQLEALKPNDEPIRVARDIDPITGEKTKGFVWRILRDLDGKYILAISTKHKRADFSKREMENERGAWKHRKMVLVIDGVTPHVYVELIQPVMKIEEIKSFELMMRKRHPKYNEQKILHEIKKELARVARVNFKQVTEQQELMRIPGFSSFLYAGTESKKAQYTLQGATDPQTLEIPQTVVLPPYRYLFKDYIEDYWIPTGYTIALHEENKNAQLNSLMLQMLDIVAELHNRKKVHRDIKPDNFLIDMDLKTGKLKLEISDFDTIADFNDDDESIGTPEYNSPLQIQIKLEETSYSMAAVKALAETNKSVKRIVNSYGWRMLKKQLEKQGISEDSIPPRPDSYQIDGSSDVWAVACTYYEMVYGKRLRNNSESEKNVNADPFLKAILANEDGKIPNIREVKELYLKSQFYKDNKDKEISPPSTHINVPDTNWIQKPFDMIDCFIKADKKNKEISLDELFLNFNEAPDYLTIQKMRTIQEMRSIILKGKMSELQILAADLENSKIPEVSNPDEAAWARQREQSDLFKNVLLLLTYKIMQSKKTNKLSFRFYAPKPKDYSDKIKETTQIINQLLTEIKEAKGKSFVALYGPK